MKYLLIAYPKCSTCQKAEAWLDTHQIPYDKRHIVDQNPTYEELKNWVSLSKLPVKKFFNTSGILYRELSLKDKINGMTEEEKLKLLSSNGMLVKRPLIIGENHVEVGFNIEKWEKLNAFPSI